MTPIHFDKDGQLVTDPKESAMIVIGATVFLPAFSLKHAPLSEAVPKAESGSLKAIVRSLPFEGEVVLQPVRDHVQKALHQVARRMNIRVGTKMSIRNGERALKVWRKA